MKYFILFLIFLFLQSCSKPKTVLICGDHICINRAEAEQYFEENLTIEVKIIDKNKKIVIDLVQLNLKDSSIDNRQINIEPKKKKKVTLENKINKKVKKNDIKQNKEVVDICTIIVKCNIDEISKYLLEKEKKESFPDITVRE